MTGGIATVTLKTKHLSTYSHKVVWYTTKDETHQHSLYFDNGQGNYRLGIKFECSNTSTLNSNGTITDDVHQHYIDNT